MIAIALLVKTYLGNGGGGFCLRLAPSIRTIRPPNGVVACRSVVLISTVIRALPIRTRYPWPEISVRTVHTECEATTFPEPTGRTPMLVYPSYGICGLVRMILATV